jgi:hypothetical protein
LKGETSWKPAISVWRWDDAPEEFKTLAPKGVSCETVIFVPKALLASDGFYETETKALDFLSFPPKSSNGAAFAGDEWGWYTMQHLSDGSRVAFLAESTEEQS